ncbi:hypothetical protein AGMMS50256_33790 [Betaproteobacteria bacterium]|nr:hypothetical protein AGMMS50256_33790 [Betaproteobacteria bacterium]
MKEINNQKKKLEDIKTKKLKTPNKKKGGLWLSYGRVSSSQQVRD